MSRLAKKEEIDGACLINEKNQEVLYLNDSNMIGRSRSNDIVLEYDELSRNHAEIHLQGESWVITDRGSSNGTRVNGVKLNAHEAHTILDGDIIKLGTIEFVFYYTSDGEVTNGNFSLDKFEKTDFRKFKNDSKPLTSRSSRRPVNNVFDFNDHAHFRSSAAPVLSHQIREDYSQYLPAGFLLRLVASIIDGFILGIAQQLIWGAAAATVKIMGLPPFLSGILGLFLGYGAMFSYYKHYYQSSGQTFGKKVMKIKVVPVGSDQITNGQILLREFFAKGFVVLGWFIFIWFYLANKEKRAYHDIWAKTKVVKV